MNNAQKTLARLYMATLREIAAKVSHEDNPLREGQEAQEWMSAQECIEAKLTNRQSVMGDTWRLAILGYRSPSWALGIQGSNR